MAPLAVGMMHDAYFSDQSGFHAFQKGFEEKQMLKPYLYSYNST